ncbi:MAG TPA: M20/M25/M40 family metallo-hydrolase [Tepidisphaeraceae bacterium]|nr:M20/M25/M40 family metallo-hydrolase [Tepidisphaeraceae bacterium]
MKLLHEICSLPTAPFAEDRVVEYVERFARQRRLKLSRDEFGNLLIELAGSRSRAPRWVFAAHMDHPGFVATRMRGDGRTLEAAFRGWVLADYVKGAKVRFFDGDREVTGVVQAVKVAKERPVPESVTVKVAGPVAPGSPGMFDQGEARTKGKRFYSRAIDDLAGAAAALQMLDALRKKPPASPVAVLLTRAEEEGFIGAIAASLKPKLLRKTDRIIAIETSAMQPCAPQGAGAIIRVGDKTSIFNSQLTYFLTQQAEALAKRDKSFRYQRALMPGGTCEATVYDVYGFTAASICIALGNYHNMDRAKKRIGPEYIDLTDWRNMVKLFVQIARNGHTLEPGHRALRTRVEKRYQKLKHLLIR